MYNLYNLEYICRKYISKKYISSLRNLSYLLLHTVIFIFFSFRKSHMSSIVLYYLWGRNSIYEIFTKHETSV